MQIDFWNKLDLSALNPFRRNDGFVALDIGSSAIKMVEVEVDKNGYRLLNMGIQPIPAMAIQNNMVADKDLVVKAIQNLIRKHGVRSTQVVAAVPGRVAIIKKIQLPAQGEEELDANVEFQASQLIPDTLENVNLDYQALDYVENSDRMDVLLVAVKKDIINSYTQAIKEAELVPAIVDVDYFAMENMFEINYEPEASGVVGLVHIGARYTSINVLKRGISAFTGDLPVGGESFTEALVHALQLSYEQAETLKVSGGSDAKKQAEVEKLLKPTADYLASEISRTLSLYRAMADEGGIHKIYLSGGGAKTAGLSRIIADRLGLEVELIDPFRGFTVARGIDPDDLAEAAPALAVGAGLAIRRPGDK
ncbi:MAG TPA: type IV pilus assembly protein PilM [Verrucomicrobiae bacterium]|jgi:type IV pilus assembly protein PilM|nr:type IV pilus assembly protein PilM [Verrucomicrobiae bacterium]